MIWDRCARAQVVITAAQGGHTAPVQALLPFGQWLVSADWLGHLKVWDMASGACVQTLQKAHADLIMGLLAWEVRSPFAPPEPLIEVFPISMPTGTLPAKCLPKLCSAAGQWQRCCSKHVLAAQSPARHNGRAGVSLATRRYNRCPDVMHGLPAGVCTERGGELLAGLPDQGVESHGGPHTRGSPGRHPCLHPSSRGFCHTGALPAHTLLYPHAHAACTFTGCCSSTATARAPGRKPCRLVELEVAHLLCCLARLLQELL